MLCERQLRGGKLRFAAKVRERKENSNVRKEKKEHYEGKEPEERKMERQRKK